MMKTLERFLSYLRDELRYLVGRLHIFLINMYSDLGSIFSILLS